MKKWFMSYTRVLKYGWQHFYYNKVVSHHPFIEMKNMQQGQDELSSNYAVYTLISFQELPEDAPGLET